MSRKRVCEIYFSVKCSRWKINVADRALKSCQKSACLRTAQRSSAAALTSAAQPWQRRFPANVRQGCVTKLLETALHVTKYEESSAEQ